MALVTNKNLDQPWSQWEEVDVTFSAANTDLEVPHNLIPINPEQVYYTVLRADRAVRVYHDTAFNRKPWQPTFIILRADAANAKVTLLLTVSHKVRTLTF